MKKGTKHIVLIIAGISIALIGLISLQIYLLLVSYEQKEQAFERNALNAMNTVSRKLEVEEAAGRIFNVLVNTTGSAPERIAKKFPAFKHDTDTFFIKTPSSGTKQRVLTDGNNMRIEIFESHGADTTIAVKGSAKKSSSVSFSYGYQIEGGRMQFNGRMNDSAWIVYIDSSSAKRKELVTKVVDKLAFIEQLPIDKRIERKRLDSLLAASFLDAEIHLPYSFAVFVGMRDSLVLQSDSADGNALHVSSLKTQLFSNDVLSPRYTLAVLFPDRTSFVLKEMTALVVLSILFMGIIIFCFVYVIRLIFSQKRFGESVINFINNMTHEFKTPISTIALASEAIAKPETMKSKARLTKYNAVIADENLRMKRQVDKILQMAVLEEGEFELKRSPVNLHEVIEQAVKNISLQIEQKGGSIVSSLNAKNFVVEGDAVHLTNIIHNVLDNAIKYSPQTPDIRIGTSSDTENLSIVVQDSGVGISKENLARIFDKYYRVPTGNTHDVKGFGLGLSYVKLIVEAHQGTVSISSELGKGTRVEIKLSVHPE
ncbi:MAG: HAMP domain-containing histidine kinase [Ignavibacteriales bacterium]|nr:HAMP domain-containing histidine kinase [Ignavibacteriales bacterium]